MYPPPCAVGQVRRPERRPWPPAGTAVSSRACSGPGRCSRPLVLSPAARARPGLGPLILPRLSPRLGHCHSPAFSMSSLDRKSLPKCRHPEMPHKGETGRQSHRWTGLDPGSGTWDLGAQPQHPPASGQVPRTRRALARTQPDAALQCSSC